MDGRDGHSLARVVALRYAGSLPRTPATLAFGALTFGDARIRTINAQRWGNSHRARVTCIHQRHTGDEDEATDA